MKKIFYDFEVFKYLWLVVFIDYDTKEKTVIINDVGKLRDVYERYKDDIFLGYNSRNYDSVMFRGILQGLTAWDINNKIINENKKAFQILDKNKSIQLNNFDLIMLNKSLKQLEGFMGSKIKESDVPFDLPRDLTQEEINEVIQYCTHDVQETIKVFDYVKEEFDSQLSLITAFDLPMEMFNKTKAQISAKILGAERNTSRSDEFDISFPDTLKLSEKYQYVLDWYNEPKNRNYKRSLNTNIAGVPHTFGWGGIHGAITNCHEEGIILCCDVASLYPAIMIEYNFLSRNVKDKNKYREIRDTRLKLKAEKNPMQAPYKIVLNSTFGASKDEMNDLYDPLMANNVCVAGQLLLVDLIEKIEPYCKLIQSNTDGLFMKVETMESVEKIKEVAKEWETRMRLNLEWEIFSKIYQKDVNNYIIINNEGKYKSKGAYVKKLSDIDYDLPIINTALINYFVNGTPVEQTVLKCEELKQFQKIVKITSLYKYALHGDKKIKEKILRVFASNDGSPGVFKFKGEDKIEKIGNTPDSCFIWNEEVNGIGVPKYLDKEYYVALAQKRLQDFLIGGNKTCSKPKSEIKGVNAEVKETIENLDLSEYESFVDFLVAVVENKIANKTHLTNLTKLNYFEQFGGNKKLISIIDEFFEGSNKYSKSNKSETKQKKIELLKSIENDLEDDNYSIAEQMDIESDLLGYLQVGFDIDKRYLYVMDVDTKYSPRATLYCLSNLSYDKIKTMKIPKLAYNKNHFKKGDILYCEKCKERFKSVPDVNSKNGFSKDYSKKEWWLEKYTVIKNFYY